MVLLTAMEKKLEATLRMRLAISEQDAPIPQVRIESSDDDEAQAPGHTPGQEQRGQIGCKTRPVGPQTPRNQQQRIAKILLSFSWF